MKIPFRHRASSFILSFLVLFSTFSFTVEKHFCGDNLVDIAVFSEAKKCGSLDSGAYVKKSCCKDTIDVVEGQDELNTAEFEDLDQSLKLTLLAHIQSYVPLYESLPKAVVPHKDYSPPRLIKDIQVFDETFLI